MDITAILSSVIAFVSAIIAGVAFIKQKEAAKVNTNLILLGAGQSMLLNHPELLELHNINATGLEANNITPTEFVYILNSLYAGVSYYSIEGKKSVQLSSYRKNFLDNPKVKLCWENFIREKMVHPGAYTKAIDKYYGLS